jgi:hypothetical protein
VNYILRREHTSKCDPFHNRRKKTAANLSLRRFGGIRPDRALGSYLTGSPGPLSSGGCG